MARPGLLSGADYLSIPRGNENWLIRPLIPSGGAAIIYADPKVGKSYLAIQLALALTGPAQEWMGFGVAQHGRVAYIQLDTPGGVWSERLDSLRREGLPIDTLYLADRDTVEHYPFDILQPGHVAYLRSILTAVAPMAVVLDTMRELHSGEEDSSTNMRNVLVNLRAACGQAAMILISHARKPHQDVERNLLADMRGSGAVVASVDAIIRLTKKAMYFTGRSIEEGSFRIERQENGFWLPMEDDTVSHVANVLADTSLPTLRAKSRTLAPLIHRTDEAALALLRRVLSKAAPKRASVITEARAQIALASTSEGSTAEPVEVQEVGAKIEPCVNLPIKDATHSTQTDA